MRRRSAQPGAVPARSRARASHPAARWLQRGRRPPRRPGCTGRRLPRGVCQRARGGTRSRAAARATADAGRGCRQVPPEPGVRRRGGGRVVGVAAELIRSRRPAAVTDKGDRDEVTDVDLAVERTIRDLLAEATPGIGFLGEEEGRSGDTARTQQTWVLDPIDGTVNYAAGSSLCAVSLALLEDGQPVLGVIDLPFLDQRYWATAGGGAFLNDRPIHAPETARTINEGIVALGDFATGPGAA